MSSLNQTSKHWFEIPQLYGAGGFDKLTYSGFDQLKDTSSQIAQSNKARLQEVGIWDFSGDIFSFISSRYSASNFVYQKISGGAYAEVSLTVQEIKDCIDYIEASSNEDRRQVRASSRQEILIQNILRSREGYAYSGSGSSRIKIYFKNIGDDQNGNDLGIKAGTNINGIPRTNAGTPWAATQTKNNGEVGVFESGEISDSDPKNTSSGPLDLTYNANTGKFGTYSTFMAKLLTDIEPVNIIQGDLNLNNIQGANSSDFYGADPVNNFSSFTTGAAIPLSMQNKNPNFYGPNIIKCKANQQLETIRVVNRSNLSFQRGEHVLVHKVDGENLIAKYMGEQLVQLPPKPGRWVFAQFYASSDEYFRYKVDKEVDLNYRFDRPALLPDECIDMLRRRAYLSGPNAFKPPDDSNNNDAYARPPDTGILFSYYPWEVTDLHLEEFGIIYNRINIYHGLNLGGEFVEGIGTDNVEQREVPLFWGPVFVEGLTGKPAEFSGVDDKQIPARIAMPNTGFNYIATINAVNSAVLTAIKNPITHLNITNPLRREVDKEGKVTFVPISPYEVYGSNHIQPNNDRRVQFSFLSAELVGASDLAASEQYLADDVRIFGGTTSETRVRRFYNTSAIYAKSANSSYDYQNGYALLRKTLQRRAHIATARDYSGPWSLYDSVLAGTDKFVELQDKADASGILVLPYDNYVQYPPLNRPIGAPAMFGGDTAPNIETYSKYRGANGVGITAAKLRMNQGSGGSWTLNVDVDQTIGIRGRFFGGAVGGGIAVTIISALLAFSTDQRGKRIEGYVPYWGNREDAIDSFGTGAVHVRVWDAWPDEQTIWLPQYFTALHYNPISYESDQEEIVVTDYSSAVRNPGQDTWQTPPQRISLQIDKINTSVDMRVPTYGDTKTFVNANGTTSTFPSYGTGLDGQTIREGTIITEDTILRPEPLWRTTIYRRGKLVTKYGYVYPQLVIGVDPTSMYHDGFTVSDFADGDEFELPDGVIVVYQSNGNRFAIKRQKLQIDNRFNSVEFDAAGSGLLPQDFGPGGKIYTISPKRGGPALKMGFSRGKAYFTYGIDTGPKPRTPITRVTLKSGDGTRRSAGQNSVSLQIEGNATDGNNEYKGQYEVHFHVHNDIGFVLHEIPNPTIGYAMANYATITLR